MLHSYVHSNANDFRGYSNCCKLCNNIHIHIIIRIVFEVLLRRFGVLILLYFVFICKIIRHMPLSFHSKHNTQLSSLVLFGRFKYENKFQCETATMNSICFECFKIRSQISTKKEEKKD